MPWPSLQDQRPRPPAKKITGFPPAEFLQPGIDERDRSTLVGHHDREWKAFHAGAQPDLRLALDPSHSLRLLLDGRSREHPRKLQRSPPGNRAKKELLPGRFQDRLVVKGRQVPQDPPVRSLQRSPQVRLA